jgi:hypothetical protein
MNGDFTPGALTDLAAAGRNTGAGGLLVAPGLLKAGKLPPATGVEFRDEPTEGGTEEERTMISQTQSTSQ